MGWKSWGRPAAPASSDGPAFQLAASAVRAVIAEAVVLPGLLPGATDSRHFADVADEVVRFVPERVQMELVGGAHGRDERIRIEQLAQSVEIAVEMVRRAGRPE